MAARSPEQERTAIGSRLRALRQTAGLTLRDVARELNVSPATWSAVENGRTGLSQERRRAVARLFGVGLNALDEDPQRSSAPDAWRRFDPLRLSPPLQGALEVFVEVGYHGATIRQIANRAGLSVPGLYHHWPSKQQLLVALLDLTMLELLTRSRLARAEADGPVERFSRLVECLALFHTHRRELGFIGASEMRSVQEPDRARIVASRVEQQRMVDDEVVEGCRRGHMATSRPHEASRAVVTMCTALPQWWSPSGHLSPDDVARHYVEFACDLVNVTD